MARAEVGSGSNRSANAAIVGCGFSHETISSLLLPKVSRLLLRLLGIDYWLNCDCSRVLGNRELSTLIRRHVLHSNLGEAAQVFQNCNDETYKFGCLWVPVKSLEAQ